jgi:hypothetical protein
MTMTEAEARESLQLLFDLVSEVAERLSATVGK